MKDGKEGRLRFWWLPYLQALLGIAFIIGCYFWWMRGGSGGGFGSGAGSGFGSGAGPGIGSGNGGKRGFDAAPRPGTAKTGTTSVRPVKSPSPAPPSPAPRSETAGTSGRAVPAVEKEEIPDTPVAVSRRSGTGSAAGAVPSGGGGGGGGAGDGRFYGLRVVQDENVLFLIDVSGSMADPAGEGRPRLQVLKRELIRSIRPRSGEKSGSGCFFILSYADRPEMVPSGREKPFRFNRPPDTALAVRAIHALGCRGSTNMELAWRHALTWIRIFRIRRVYFLSDGEASDDFTARQFTALRQTAGSSFRVDCIAIGGDSPLLREIARISGGRYRMVH